VTIQIPSHLNTSPHTNIALGQWRKRWVEFSSFPTHLKHSQGIPWDKQPRKSRFFLVGILSRSSCQEKAITFDGAELSQIWANTLANPSSPSYMADSSSQIWANTTANHLQQSSSKVKDTGSKRSFKLETRSSSHRKRFLRQVKDHSPF
jgi:hypothetical protein